VPALLFSLRSRLHRPSRAIAGILILTVLLAACGSAATPRPSSPPDATGSLVPPITATPGPSASAAPAFPVTLTDDDGTKVQLTAEPKKIVSLTPAETEVLFAIDAGDRVVGKVDDPAKYPPEADKVPIVGTFAGIDVEKIVGLGADLVIADLSKPHFQPVSESNALQTSSHRPAAWRR